MKLYFVPVNISFLSKIQVNFVLAKISLQNVFRKFLRYSILLDLTDRFKLIYLFVVIRYFPECRAYFNFFYTCNYFNPLSLFFILDILYSVNICLTETKYQQVFLTDIYLTTAVKSLEKMINLFYELFTHVLKVVASTIKN